MQQKRPVRQSDVRKNEEISASQVRVIGADGEQIGVLPIEQAIDLAFDKGLDLVEISPTTDPPVCKIIDFGKYRFEKEKKQKEAKKNQKQVELKEVRFSARIADHDYQTKLGKAKEFLADEDKVLFKLRFRGREIQHSDIGLQLFEKIMKELEETAVIEKRPYIEGRFLTMVLSPKKK